MMKIKNNIFILTLFCLFPVFFIYAQDADKMRETIRYGTDVEIAALLKTLKTDKSNDLDADLIALAEKSSNETIITSVFLYFQENEKKGLEKKAAEILSARDKESSLIITSAIDYLGNVKDTSSRSVMQEIIEEKSSYSNTAIRALGKIVGSLGGNDADETAEYLLKYYKDQSPKEEERRDIILALGNSGSKAPVPFLNELVSSDDTVTYLKSAALEAIAKIKDNDSLETILKAAHSPDAGLRVSAIAALGAFDDSKANEAIIEAFRDAFFRTRLAAVKASGEAKINSAVPYLKYRAVNDEAASVREESIKVLGVMGTDNSKEALLSLFDDQKNSDKIRIMAAESLLKADPSQYCDHIIETADASKVKKQTALYNGLIKALSSAKTPKLEGFAARLFASKDVLDNAFALDITANNNFTGFKDQVLKISETKNSTLAGKAARVLKSL
jgi:HEAT repeat protein